ncbi:hypothetical protein [Jatrophihabitans endophyticus]|uniref:hypothetical protein n=1 Tax=Jatrophihabitans endophyticus TaxID=1206085 RepID=UPI0019DB17DD|nr:hypothetical protein [Jatrophihabitans endophyticus]MBE7187201.1 hypothetical protein [Jatrophihabitans endophyticus]
MIGELIAGGGIAVVGLVIGHFEGYLMGSKVRNVSQLMLAADSSSSTLPCLCGHPVTTHRDKGNGPCAATVRDEHGITSGCPCKFYGADPAAVGGAAPRELEL